MSLCAVAAVGGPLTVVPLPDVDAIDPNALLPVSKRHSTSLAVASELHNLTQHARIS